MRIDPQSTEAFEETREQRASQEEELKRLLRHYPGGLTDRQIGEKMKLPRALASARRNGLTKKLQKEAGQWVISKVGTVKDDVSKKTVSLWAMVARGDTTQGKLF